MALLSVGLLGCPDSGDIATGELRADIDIRVTEDLGTVNASLYEGADTFSVELTDGDRLVATADGGSPLEMSADISIYRADIPLDARDIKVELLREGGDNASMSEQVPEPVMLQTTTLSLSDDPITVTWSNPIDGGLAAVFVDSCADVSFETPEGKDPVDDTGSYTLTRAEIEAEQGVSEDCAVLVIARRRFNNTAGGFFSSSAIRAERFERIEVQITP